MADLSGPARGCGERDALIARLDAAARPLVRFQDWKALDAAEIRLGAGLGKPREKIVELAQVRLAIAGNSGAHALAE